MKIIGGCLPNDEFMRRRGLAKHSWLVIQDSAKTWPRDAEGAQENSLSAGINTRFKKTIRFEKNQDFSRFSIFSGFQRCMIFKIRMRINPRLSEARRSAKEPSTSRTFHWNK